MPVIINPCEMALILAYFLRELMHTKPIHDDISCEVKFVFDAITYYDKLVYKIFISIMANYLQMQQYYH